MGEGRWAGGRGLRWLGGVGGGKWLGGVGERWVG